MRYDAFISYRHSDLDMFVAKKIHKGLETFKVPHQVAKKGGKKKINRVFRDQEELPIGSDLTNNISGALVESEYLLVICSPRTPESYWVKKEIQTFISLHDRDHVLAILIEGEPNESFPPELLTDESGNPVEPLAADVRGKNHGEMNKKLKTELLRLAAPILHCTYDDLRQRHRERRIRKVFSLITAAFMVIAGLGIGFGIYNARMAAEIQKNFLEKQVSQSKSLSDTSLSLLNEGDRRGATLVALSALPSENDDRPYVAEAEFALGKALHAYDISSRQSKDSLLKHDVTVSTIELDADGKYLTTVDNFQTVYVWDLSTYELLAKLPPEYLENGDDNDVKYANVLSGKLVVVRTRKLSIYTIDGKVEREETYDKDVNKCFANVKEGLVTLISLESFMIYDAKSDKLRRETPPLSEIKGSFNFEGAFSADGKYLVLSAGDFFEEQFIIAYDTASLSHTFYKPTESYISDLNIDNKGNVYCISYASKSMVNSSLTTRTVYVEGFAKDLDMEGPAWSHSEEVKTALFNEANAVVKVIPITDSNGSSYDILSVSLMDSIHAFKTDGTELSVAVSGYPIASFLHTPAGICFYFMRDGSSAAANLLTGTVVPSELFEDLNGTYINECKSLNGTFVFRKNRSPEILIMKGLKKETATELYKSTNTLSNAFFSPDGQYMCIYEQDDLTDKYTFSVFDSATETLVNTISTPDDEMIRNHGFTSDNNIFTLDLLGKITRYDLKTGKPESVTVGDDYFTLDESSVSCDHRYLCLSGFSDFYLFDLKDMSYKKVTENKEAALTSFPTVTDDGKTIYFFTKENHLASIDTATGKIDDSYDDKLVTIAGTKGMPFLTINKDQDNLLVACNDGNLRVVDTASKQVISTIPLGFKYHLYVSFCNDPSKLLVQGEDYFIRIFDLNENKFVYISFEPYDTLTSFSEDDDNYYLANYNELLVLNKDLYALKTDVAAARLYNPAKNTFIFKNSGTYSSMPVLSLDELKAMAKEQFGDTELSESEKLKYHID